MCGGEEGVEGVSGEEVECEEMKRCGGAERDKV